MNTLSTNTVRPRRAAGHPWLAVAVGILFLALPASAGAYYYGSDSETSSTPAVDKASSDSGLVAPDHRALNDSLAPLSGSQNPGGTGNTPTTIVYDSPSAGDGFDWADAALGAGLTMALITIGGAALITVRRRTGTSPAASTS
jgi:hypothetical protein